MAGRPEMENGWGRDTEVGRRLDEIRATSGRERLLGVKEERGPETRRRSEEREE